MFVLVDHGEGVRLEAVATFNEEITATSLADALNGVLLDRYNAIEKVNQLISSSPDSVRASVTRILPALREIYDKSPRDTRVAAILHEVGRPAFGSFPVSNCTGNCGCEDGCRDDCQSCDACENGDCEECLAPYMTPRTAFMLHAAAEILSDQSYDLAEELAEGSFDDTEEGSSWPLPDVVVKLGPKFSREMARSFEDIARDLEEGRLPFPTCLSEEIALYRSIKYAKHLAEDENSFEEELEELPKSYYDFDWIWLEEIFFEDLDFLELFGPEDKKIFAPKNLRNLHYWFGPFGIRKRDRYRGFGR
ncbi:hypothetical protein [Sphaerisporangium perillae]|uniref:hypothetical protein n=1 Tax=Sphaerisporangium perillae TaxID=2935860 RepID=UPI00200EA97E|nr:hypothetical protein [Sphaerisporangium perillae]